MKTLLMKKAIENYYTEKLCAMGLSVNLERISTRPDRAASDWDKQAKHYLVTLTRVGKKDRQVVLYSIGSGVRNIPNSADIVHSLLVDGSALFDGYDFENFANEFGYDSDSREAERIYNACLENGKKVKALFSNSEIAELREMFSDY